ncbi:M18 family aminopeptidase [Aeromicrobium sp. CnD17-E]|uniref:M18 family aminopeptidase n=1 Tax=Aeromicrobium sp. CnD17-E TaxID=2954487 RepID=UPI0020980CD2|nr:M18 family aminopeptidase [Aeromicrobium sp. CnD17-E]MCO7240581.1 M18 family aminopeptidase [Aeromicrobium sp. CnD17-E]
MGAADDLCRFVDASPSPFHAVATAAAALESAGWSRVDERAAWPGPGGRGYVVRGGSLVAWDDSASSAASDPFRIVGAHTDSPTLRLKQHHDRRFEGTDVLALEPYGGPLLTTWLDRDLGVAGRVVLRDGQERLVHVDEPVLRVPNLAIHLDRDAAGAPDRQRHLDAIWAQRGTPFLAWLGEREGFGADEVLGFELMTADVVPSARVGVDGWLVAAPRLDNQATCFAGLQALLDSGAGGRAPVDGQRPVLVLFDHEEVGSSSERGAASDLLLTVLERIVLAAGGDRDDLHRAVAGSVCASGDMAHATHPNHAERHEPLHHVRLGAGPVLKVNQNLRYATDAVGAAVFARACEHAGVPLQRYVHRADLPCGSTIGPISAARTGITTVDFGAPQLAMHSARETMAAADVDHYVRALTAFFALPA